MLPQIQALAVIVLECVPERTWHVVILIGQRQVCKHVLRRQITLQHKAQPSPSVLLFGDCAVLHEHRTCAEASEVVTAELASYFTELMMT